MSKLLHTSEDSQQEFTSVTPTSVETDPQCSVGLSPKQLASAEETLAFLRRQAARHHRLRYGHIAFTCLAALGTIFERWLAHHNHHASHSDWFSFVNLTNLPVMAILWYQSQSWAEKASKVVTTIPPCDAGFFIEGLSMTHGCKDVAEVVIKIISRVGPEDGRYLTEPQRALLRRRISTSVSSKHDRQLTIAILRLIRTIGDTDSLQAVEKLAAGKGQGNRYGEVRDAAHVCAAALNKLLDQSPDAISLLRASEPEAEMPDTLLRPAEEKGTLHTEELLKSANRI